MNPLDVTSTIFACDSLYEAAISRFQCSEVGMDQIMSQFGRLFNLGLRYVFEPGLDWVLDHPIVSVAVVAVLVYWSVRGYRMI